MSKRKGFLNNGREVPLQRQYYVPRKLHTNYVGLITVNYVHLGLISY